MKFKAAFQVSKGIIDNRSSEAIFFQDLNFNKKNLLRRLPEEKIMNQVEKQSTSIGTEKTFQIDPKESEREREREREREEIVVVWRKGAGGTWVINGDQSEEKRVSQKRRGRKREWRVAYRESGSLAMVSHRIAQLYTSIGRRWYATSLSLLEPRWLSARRYYEAIVESLDAT